MFTERMLKSLLSSYFDPLLKYEDRINNYSIENSGQFIDFLGQKCFDERHYVRFDIDKKKLAVESKKMLEVIFCNYKQLSGKDLPDDIKSRVTNAIGILYGEKVLFYFPQRKGSLISYLLLLYEIEIIEVLSPYVYWNWRNEFLVLYPSHQEVLTCMLLICEKLMKLGLDFKQFYFGHIFVDGFIFQGLKYKYGIFHVDDIYLENFIEHIVRLTNPDKLYKSRDIFTKQINKCVQKFVTRYKNILTTFQLTQIDTLIETRVKLFLDHNIGFCDSATGDFQIKKIGVEPSLGLQSECSIHNNDPDLVTNSCVLRN
jgi:hypothetical protein